METVFKVIVLFSLGLVAYTYVAYYVVLWLLGRLRTKLADSSPQGKGGAEPTVSIIVAAHNEEKAIRERLENILALDYPHEKLEIIVCSDGSTDRTCAYAREYAGPRLKVCEFTEQRGKAAVTNDGVSLAQSEIVVFTDAETRFHPDFLKKVVVPFSQDRVGCVVGRLTYLTGKDSVSHSEGLYWRYELKLRELEDRLGLLATATGACMALRRQLFRPLDSISDADSVSPLDCLDQGYRVKYEPQAIAYDFPPASPLEEFQVRVRQTSKNLMATLGHWGPKQWRRYPAVTWALFSHKILRWLTPFFLLLALLSNLPLAAHSPFFTSLLALQLLFYFLGLVGWLAFCLGKRLPGASLAFTFFLANLGMFLGIFKVLSGKAPAAYGKHRASPSPLEKE